MKISTIALVILVSVVVWTVFYLILSWMPPGGPITAFLITLAGAVLGIVVLHLVKNLIPLSFWTQILFAALGSLLLFFILLQFRKVPPPVDLVATLNCTTLSVTPDTIVVLKNQSVSWNLVDTRGTVVTIDDFRHHILRFWKRSPFDQKVLTGTIPGVIGPVKVKKTGRFKYSFTCAPSTGNPTTVDPMFDVPR